MKVILFGATGMVGQGVLRECLLDPEVTTVVSVVRRSGREPHPKLRELIHSDFHDFTSVERELAGFDACFFALGISSVGLTEDAYRKITVDITRAAGTALARVNPGLTFVFVSGAGADSTERGSTMWARVKGEAENVVLRLPIKASYVFRPGIIRPLHGIKSRTTAYRIGYTIAAPLMALIVRGLPQLATTTEQIGRAMLAVAKHGFPKRVLETADINQVR
jgi:uncharacterized protein YbjT (DUF2867 family)